MAFQVDITEPALADAADYVAFIRTVRRESEAAEKWFRGLVDAIYSLEDLPDRCPVIPEQEEFPFEIRHLIYILSPDYLPRRTHEAADRGLPRVSRLQAVPHSGRPFMNRTIWTVSHHSLLGDPTWGKIESPQ